MRTLFEIDLKDYITGGTVCTRPSVREFGMVHRVQKGLVEDMFIQDNYYLCRVKEGQGSQSLDDYEAEEDFRGSARPMDIIESASSVSRCPSCLDT